MTFEVIEKTGKQITEEEADELRILYYVASRTPVLSYHDGLDSSKRENAWHKLQMYMIEISKKYKLLPFKDDDLELKIGEDYELVYIRIMK